MKLIVGLGNPGKEYENTRHNIGFMVVDNYILKKGISDSWKNKFKGLFLEANIKGEKVIFLKPQSYMNLSGGVVSQFVNFYKINLDDIIVISDDLDLCEDCGEWKNVVVARSRGYQSRGLQRLVEKIFSRKNRFYTKFV